MFEAAWTMDQEISTSWGFLTGIHHFKSFEWSLGGEVVLYSAKEKEHLSSKHVLFSSEHQFQVWIISCAREEKDVIGAEVQFTG